MNKDTKAPSYCSFVISTLDNREGLTHEVLIKNTAYAICEYCTLYNIDKNEMSFIFTEIRPPKDALNIYYHITFKVTEKGLDMRQLADYTKEIDKFFYSMIEQAYKAFELTEYADCIRCVIENR